MLLNTMVNASMEIKVREKEEGGEGRGWGLVFGLLSCNFLMTGGLHPLLSDRHRHVQGLKLAIIWPLREINDWLSQAHVHP